MAERLTKLDQELLTQLSQKMTLTQAERITALEVQVFQLRQDIEQKVEDIKEKQKETAGKMDELLAMRNRGIGAFWLASTLLGTGIVGFIVQVIAWFKH